MTPVELAELRAQIQWVEPRRLALGEAWPRYHPMGATDAETLRRIEVIAFAPEVESDALGDPDGHALYAPDAAVVLDYVAPPRRAIVELRLVDTLGTPIESTPFRLDAQGHRRFGHLGADGAARAYDVPAGPFEVAYYEQRDIHSKVWAHRALRAVTNRDGTEALRLLRLHPTTLRDVEDAWQVLSGEQDLAAALRSTASDEGTRVPARDRAREGRVRDGDAIPPARAPAAARVRVARCTTRAGAGAVLLDRRSQTAVRGGFVGGARRH